MSNEITKEIYDAVSHGWDSQEALQAHVDAIVSNKPEALAKTSFTIRRTVLDRVTGSKAEIVERVVLDAEPVLTYSEDHPEDMHWGYTELSRKRVAGPASA